MHLKVSCDLCSFLPIMNMSGHAPHDEVPAEVNSLLCEWTEETDVKPALEKSKAIR
jgi:hypothetical protein